MPLKLDPDAYYDEGEVSEALGVSRNTLRRNRQARSDLSFCKYGRVVFYRGRDLIDLLDGARRSSTSDRQANRSASPPS